MPEGIKNHGQWERQKEKKILNKGFKNPFKIKK